MVEMFAGLTDAANRTCVDVLIRGRLYVPPATLEVGLSVLDANPAGLVSEPAGCGYRRAVSARGDWGLDGSGRCSNRAAIEFPRPLGDWGVVRSLFVAEGGPGGRVILSVAFRRPLHLGPGAFPPVIDPGGLFVA